MKMKQNFLMRRGLLAIMAGCAVLVIAAGLISVWRFERNARVPIRVAMHVARNSAELQTAIGTPMQVEPLARGDLIADRGNGNADLMVRIKGPKGRGVLGEWAQEVAGQWHICSLDFRSQDGVIRLTLVDEASTHCERE